MHFQGSLDLLKAGTKLEELPKDPTCIAAAQWKELSKRGKEAIRLFKAYAILEVGVPNEVVESVSELDTDTLQSVLADNYVAGLLREEGEGKQIYHAILADYILEQISDDEKNQYHSRAVEIYRGKLAKAKKEKIRPDALSAMRLAEHVLAAEGKVAFVYAFANECYDPLTNLGLFDVAISLSERALGMVEKDSKEEAVVLGNLGLIYDERGELDKAEEILLKTLEIDEKLELQEGMANSYSNLGIIYSKRGDLDKAEEMCKKSLEIAERLGLWEVMARGYGNLGIVYQTRGELDKAEEIHVKSLEIAEKLGSQESMASGYTALGLVHYRRGDLGDAEKMHIKGLEIEKKIGRLQGMARQYGNLGGIYEQRGDVGKAKEYWEQAVELYKRIGMPYMVETVQEWIEGEKSGGGPFIPSMKG